MKTPYQYWVGYMEKTLHLLFLLDSLKASNAPFGDIAHCEASLTETASSLRERVLRLAYRQPA